MNKLKLRKSRYPTKTNLRAHASMTVRRALARTAAEDIEQIARAASEGASETGTHTPQFISAVLEAAAKIENEGDAREFAKSYLERDAESVSTPAGVAATRFEAWLVGKSRKTLAQFVETIIEDATFLVVFEGDLEDIEMKRMAQQTSEFVASMKVLVRAGSKDPETNMVSDLTVLEATPVKGAKMPKDAEAPPMAPGAPRTPEPRRDEFLRGESVKRHNLMPVTEADYALVRSEGGITTSAVAFVHGRSALRDATVDQLGSWFVDANNRTWLRTEGSDRWVPLVERPHGASPADLVLWKRAQKIAQSTKRTGADLQMWAEQWYEKNGGTWESVQSEASIQPPGLRRAQHGESCQTCAAFDPDAAGPGVKPGGNCDEYAVKVKPWQVCDSWDAHQGGGPDEDLIEDANEKVPTYETVDGVTRSLLGSWAVFESNGIAVVVARDNAWAVPSLRAALELVESVSHCYERELCAEEDLAIEHALFEWAEHAGREVQNVPQIVEVAGPRYDLIAQRNHLIEAASPAPARPFVAKGGEPPGSDAPAAAAPAAPSADDEDEGDDRMEDPEFYRQDLQTYYDVQVLGGMSDAKAMAKTKSRFGLKKLVVTPTGEVRSPGVIDRKAPAPPLPPPMDAVPPAPLEQPDGVPDGAPQQAQSTTATGGAPEESVQSPPPLVKKLAQRAGVAMRDAYDRWKKAGTIVSKQYPDAEPESDKWYQLKVGVFKRSLGITAEAAQSPVATLDDALVRWSMTSDDLIEFEEWLGDNYPDLLANLESWVPRDVTESKTTRAVLPRLSAEQSERFEKWRRLVNMRPHEIRSFARSVDEVSISGLRALNLGLRASRHALAMKSRPPTDWTTEDWDWCSRQLNTLRKMLLAPGPMLDEHDRPTQKLTLLRAWGHDPNVPTRTTEAAMFVAQRGSFMCSSCGLAVLESAVQLAGAGWKHACGAPLTASRDLDESVRRRANRLLDCSAGPAPFLIGEEAPTFAELRRGRLTLEPAERARVEAAGATWNDGKLAVWRSQVGRKTYYVTNTHRAFAVAQDLDGALAKFHGVIVHTR